MLQKNVLVTGGAGFIGSNFVQHMVRKYKSYRIINLDALTYAGNLENLREVENNENYNFIKGSIVDQELVNRIFQEYSIDILVNFAAESHVDRSIKDPGIFLETNVVGTQKLLDTAKSAWQIGLDENGYPVYKQGTRFHQVSTDEVYGTLGKDGMFTESSPLAPNSPYSASKASADLLVRAYHETYKLPITISRCSNNYGPYHFPEKLIPLMIVNSLHGKELPVYGDGLQIRDWLYVQDHCEAIDVVIHKGNIGEVYNIGGNNEKTNIEIVRLIMTKLGKNENMIRYVKDRLGHDRRYAIDNTKISKELAWKPKYSFEKGIQTTIEWFLDNRSWWESILSGEYIHYYDNSTSSNN